MVRYLQLNSRSDFPALSYENPFKVLLISDVSTSNIWKSEIGEWLIENGCLYACVYGIESDAWSDLLDFSVDTLYEFEDVPEDRRIITTVHADRNECMHFFKVHAKHPKCKTNESVILHISKASNENEVLASYESA